MNKLKLKVLGLGAMELLTRTQLKNVLGGDGYGGGSDHCTWSGMYSNPPSFSCDASDPKAAQLAQQTADWWCEQENYCMDVDCQGA